LKYIKNNSIQTGILLEISHALQHNFFQDIANALPRHFSQNQLEDPQKITFESEQKNWIEQLEKENMVLKIQNDLLMKIKGAS
jgi:hypothetical protein